MAKNHSFIVTGIEREQLFDIAQSSVDLWARAAADVSAHMEDRLEAAHDVIKSLKIAQKLQTIKFRYTFTPAEIEWLYLGMADSPKIVPYDSQLHSMVKNAYNKIGLER